MVMNFKLIRFTLGILLLLLGAAELVPALVNYADGHPDALPFFFSSFLSMFVGGLFYLSGKHHVETIRVKDAFFLTVLSWALFGLFGSFPLYYSSLDVSFIDALFEFISGVTTTGSTVLSGLDDMSRGILLWRSILQWIGGIGIIAFAIVFLPFLKVGGMQLFLSESSDQSGKRLPRTVHLVLSLVGVYVMLSIICFFVYHMLGMGWFEALNHAMTTISTGGFSTHDLSLGYYTSPSIQWTVTLFMFLGALPFIWYVRFLHHQNWDVLEDTQVKTFAGILSVVILGLSLVLYYTDQYDWLDALRYSAFNIVSVVTTTGYMSTDYTLWGTLAVMGFFFITYMGGCTGSTSGGLKVMRIIIVTKSVTVYLRSLIYPNGVFSMQYQGRTVDRTVAVSVIGFLCLYVVANVFLTVALSLTGLDFVTAISGAATAIANVGPGLGDTIGPSGNFAALPDASKWLLCFGMLIGRLEILTVIILFSPVFWRD